MNPINWNETYANISPKLLGICRRYIKDVGTAEDIVQDSFMVAIQKENTLKDVSAINGWLSRIVINMAIHNLKNEKKIVFSTSDNYEIADNSFTMNSIVLDNKSLILASDLDRNDILEAIDHLPEHHKSVFNMYVIDQFSHVEIAKILSISVGTSKSCLSRARKFLQAFLLEKAKGKTVDEEKKRRLIFFLILGFGNSMFANFYKKPFDNFEILPLKPFSFSQKNNSLPTAFIALKKTIPFAKILMLLGVCFLVGSLFFLFKPSPSKNVLKEEQEVFKDSLPQKQITKPKKLNQKAKSKKEISTSKLKAKINLSNSKTESITPIKSETKAEIIAESKRDSVEKEVKKVVVIKRQVVKKDTVYVTK
jgi:RNA polymerase sigma factor (sigma-70 family)